MLQFLRDAVVGLQIWLFLSQSFVTAITWDDFQHQRVKVGNNSLHLRYAGNGPPILLVHGSPQHSLGYSVLGPILAASYTVICPDNRGAGDSTIPRDEVYTASAVADDMKAILDFLNINQTYVFAHDKGTGIATALAAKYPQTVARLGVSEYPLPGFGYEQFWDPSSGGGIGWTQYSNWQLAFFSVPDAAQYFIQGREKEMLAWYFFHSSYSANDVISEDYINRYTTTISKVGFLRAMFGYFSVETVTSDAEFFNSTFSQQKLGMPVLALGGEASLAPASVSQQLFDPVASDLQVDVVPKAGHWILDENPQWVASRILQFLDEDKTGIPSVDLSYLANKVTLV